MVVVVVFVFVFVFVFVSCSCSCLVWWVGRSGRRAALGHSASRVLVSVPEGCEVSEQLQRESASCAACIAGRTLYNKDC